MPYVEGGTLTYAWNDGSTVAHGANNPSGDLVYTGSTSYGTGSGA